MADIPASIIIGLVCGLLGAGFVAVNQTVNDVRKYLLKRKWLKIIETLMLCIVTTTVFYMAPYVI